MLCLDDFLVCAILCVFYIICIYFIYISTISIIKSARHMELVTINKYRVQSSRLNTLLRPKALIFSNWPHSTT